MLIALYLGHLSVSVSLSVATWLKYNGPAVELVAVCVAADEVFAKVPINGRKFSCPGISVIMTLIVDG